MRPLILATFDNLGGAARSALRLHQGLRTIGVPSKMLVQGKLTDDKNIIGPANPLEESLAKIRSKLDTLPLKIYRHRKNASFSTGMIPFLKNNEVSKINPDVINLHWVCGGYLRPEDFKNFHQPLIWTLHDMWAFTGGCHYDEECRRYEHSCGRCPILGSNRENDLSRMTWNRKNKSWKDLPLTIVTPSRWLSKEAKESRLFSNREVKTIPYGLDLKLFQPLDKMAARQRLHLPKDKKLVLFAAYGEDPRKGIQFLEPAFKELVAAGKAKDLELLILGSRSNKMVFSLPVHNMGLIEDEAKLAEIYSAADVFVAPSTQDNLPNTVLEALACGVPSVSFDIGGLPDMIDHKKNGYLAKPLDSKDLAGGIVWILEEPKKMKELSYAARNKALEEYPLELQAQRYLKLYEAIVSQQSRK